MAGIINYVQMIETRPLGIPVRRWRAIRHAVMNVMGLHWHQQMLPRHFAANAANVYKYQRRSAAYLERKSRTAGRGSSGHRFVDRRAATDQLTFSGTLRANVQTATIRTFEQRFKLVMPGTLYTPDRPLRPNQPPIAQEVTRLLEYEKRDLAKLGKSTAVSEINRTGI